MLDLETIKARNVRRKVAEVIANAMLTEQGITGPHDPELSDTIDTLIAEVERLRAVLQYPLFPGYDTMEVGKTYLMPVLYSGKRKPRIPEGLLTCEEPEE